VKFMNEGAKVDAYAHPNCIERHNKDVQKNLHALHVSTTADFVLDRDINPDDTWSVECLLRREYPELRKQPSILGDYPKFSKQFIAEVVAAAREKRDRNRMAALFETIEETVTAWPAKVSEDFIAEISTDLIDTIR
jgi:hypothetical protein